MINSIIISFLKSTQYARFCPTIFNRRKVCQIIHVRHVVSLNEEVDLDLCKALYHFKIIILIWLWCRVPPMSMLTCQQGQFIKVWKVQLLQLMVVTAYTCMYMTRYHTISINKWDSRNKDLSIAQVQRKLAQVRKGQLSVM